MLFFAPINTSTTRFTLLIFFRILYVVWKQVIRAYSTQTGDFVREFEPTDNRLTGIASHPSNLNIIIGCTETGFLVSWDSRNGLITNTSKVIIIIIVLLYFY